MGISLSCRSTAGLLTWRDRDFHAHIPGIEVDHLRTQDGAGMEGGQGCNCEQGTRQHPLVLQVELSAQLIWQPLVSLLNSSIMKGTFDRLVAMQQQQQQPVQLPLLT